jgi:hypothetical protein
MALHRPFQSLSDDQLLSALADVVGQVRRDESSLVAHIAEVDFRRLYARHACSSMFVYSTRILHLAEGEAFRRIRVARASRRHPVLLEMLADGRLHVSGIAVLLRILTVENRDRLLSLAVHKTKRHIEKLVAELDPRPDVPSIMRKLPERPAAPMPATLPVELVPGSPAGLPTAAAERHVELVPGAPAGLPPAVGERPVELVPGTAAAFPLAAVSGTAPRPVAAAVPVVEPLSASRYKVQFTGGQELHDDLERLRALLRSEIPDGDLGAIVGKAVRELRQRLDARRFAQTGARRQASARASSAQSSRYVPADVRRAVYRRDRSQCRFTDAQGRRCSERHNLEYHHRHPFGLGGGPTVDNICLICPPHNRLLAELDYGEEVIWRHIRRSKERRRSGLSACHATCDPTAPGISANEDQSGGKEMTAGGERI